MGACFPSRITHPRTNDTHRSLDSPRILFKAGKNREGYFDHDDLVSQVDRAIDIFEDRFAALGCIGAFGFDNAPSHQKRAPDALSARYMPKNPHPTWKGKAGICRMRDGTLPDGSAQPLYFDDTHPTYPGHFKGMKQILKERGLWPYTTRSSEPNAECQGFKCAEGASACCARRMLFNQPDFKNQKPAIIEFVENRGHIGFLYPKYHCELNFIEQAWGVGKRKYREFPPTSTEAEMERNVIAALDSVPVESMRR